MIERLLGGRSDLPLYVELLRVVVTPETAGVTVEFALLRRMVEELQHSWGRVPVIVPETNLAAQLLLRDAFYKAVLILRSYFGDEDGYLMIHEFESRDTHA